MTSQFEKIISTEDMIHLHPFWNRFYRISFPLETHKENRFSDNGLWYKIWDVFVFVIRKSESVIHELRRIFGHKKLDHQALIFFFSKKLNRDLPFDMCIISSCACEISRCDNSRSASKFMNGIMHGTDKAYRTTNDVGITFQKRMRLTNSKNLQTNWT